MKIYQKNKRRNAAVIFIALGSLLLGGQIATIGFQDNFEFINILGDISVPVLLIVVHLFIYFRPYFQIKDNQIIKYDVFVKYSINLEDIEYIKTVFGDIHVKGPKKIISIEKDCIDEAEKEKLLEILKDKTSLKLA